MVRHFGKRIASFAFLLDILVIWNWTLWNTPVLAAQILLCWNVLHAQLALEHIFILDLFFAEWIYIQASRVCAIDAGFQWKLEVIGFIKTLKNLDLILAAYQDGLEDYFLCFPLRYQANLILRPFLQSKAMLIGLLPPLIKILMGPLIQYLPWYFY